VFEITKTAGVYASTPTTLVGFNSTDGANPIASLIADANGNLFGTTEYGGATDYGTVFEVAGSGFAFGPACSVTYNGTFNGNLNISSGLTCIINGTVTGNVMQNGGGLYTSNATIGGNLQITGGGTFSIDADTTIDGNLQIQNIPAGSAQNQICGTKVKGNLALHNNGTAITIGNSSETCAGNTIGNDLQIQNNTAAVLAYYDTVGGNLQCQNNTSIMGDMDMAESLQGQCAGF